VAKQNGSSCFDHAYHLVQAAVQYIPAHHRFLISREPTLYLVQVHSSTVICGPVVLVNVSKTRIIAGWRAVFCLNDTTRCSCANSTSLGCIYSIFVNKTVVLHRYELRLVGVQFASCKSKRLQPPHNLLSNFHPYPRVGVSGVNPNVIQPTCKCDRFGTLSN